MVRIDHTVVICRPIKEVFEFLTNPENNQLWQEGVVKSRQISPGPVGMGTQGEDVRKYVGREFQTTYEIVEYEPDRKLWFRSLSGPIQFEGSYSLEPVDEGTRFSFTIQGDGGPFSTLIGPLASRMARKQVESDSASLKKLLESDPNRAD
ncbi:MAG TPA: SRPBCC family protein [Dehalococcoidia bacterium]|jgi:carbon monoxide dehydrogenase subunit G|nr:SRPBCC family protein [Dehalococcoidia bacterium]